MLKILSNILSSIFNLTIYRVSVSKRKGIDQIGILYVDENQKKLYLYSWPDNLFMIEWEMDKNYCKVFWQNYETAIFFDNLYSCYDDIIEARMTIYETLQSYIDALENVYKIQGISPEAWLSAPHINLFSESEKGYYGSYQFESGILELSEFYGFDSQTLRTLFRDQMENIGPNLFDSMVKEATIVHELRHAEAMAEGFIPQTDEDIKFLESLAFTEECEYLKKKAIHSGDENTKSMCKSWFLYTKATYKYLFNDQLNVKWIDGNDYNDANIGDWFK